MSKRALGIVILVAAIVVAVVATQFGGEESTDPIAGLLRQIKPETVNVLAFVGGEKRLYVENPVVQEILASDHGVVLDARRAGSIEMVTEPRILEQKPDLLWPGSEIAAEIGKRAGLRPVRTDTIFSSPIVLFSWLPVADALAREGVASPMPGSNQAYRVDTRRLIELIDRKRTWSTLGRDEIFGTVMVFSTDPRHSNSGNQFATLVAMMMAGGQQDAEAIRPVLPKVATLFRRMGYMERSSFDLFDQYLRTGMTAKPIIAGYENQLIEFAGAQPDLWKQIETQPVRPVILYPEPTVYASHVALAFSEKGVRAIDALRDPKLLELAWSAHGFRAGFAGSAAPSDLPIRGVPVTVPQVIPSPPAEVVEEIIAALDAGS